MYFPSFYLTFFLLQKQIINIDIIISAGIEKTNLNNAQITVIISPIAKIIPMNGIIIAPITERTATIINPIIIINKSVNITITPSYYTIYYNP